MSWSYDTSLLTDEDQLRFKIGDTDEADQLLSDEEIGGVLAMEGSVALAAQRAAQTLAIMFARKAEEVKDDLGAMVRYGDRAAHFRTLAVQLSSGTVLLSVPLSGRAATVAGW